MKKENLYSILIKNNFKLPSNSCPTTVMYYRGYIGCFIKSFLKQEDKELLRDVLPLYTNNQWRDLLLRFWKEGHYSEAGILG